MGGELSFDHNRYSSKPQSGSRFHRFTDYTIGAQPTVGYFITSGLVAGMGIDFQYNIYKEGSDNTRHTIMRVGVSPFIRYYFLDGLFGVASYSYGVVKPLKNYGTSDQDFHSWRAGLGYAIFLNKHIAIEPILTYGSRTNTIEAGGVNSEGKVRINGLQFSVGFNFFLHKQKED